MFGCFYHFSDFFLFFSLIAFLTSFFIAFCLLLLRSRSDVSMLSDTRFLLPSTNLDLSSPDVFFVCFLLRIHFFEFLQNVKAFHKHSGYLDFSFLMLLLCILHSLLHFSRSSGSSLLFSGSLAKHLWHFISLTSLRPVVNFSIFSYTCFIFLIMVKSIFDSWKDKKWLQTQ